MLSTRVSFCIGWTHFCPLLPNTLFQIISSLLDNSYSWIQQISDAAVDVDLYYLFSNYFIFPQSYAYKVSAIDWGRQILTVQPTRPVFAASCHNHLDKSPRSPENKTPTQPRPPKCPPCINPDDAGVDRACNTRRAARCIIRAKSCERSGKVSLAVVTPFNSRVSRASSGRDVASSSSLG